MGKSAVWKKMSKVVPAVAITLGMSAGSVFAAQNQQGKGDENVHQNNMLIDVQLLGINDLHGQLDVTRKVGGKEVGRADYLAAYLEQREATNPKNTLLLHAGDAVGASAPTSSLLQDEPTIKVLNKLDFDAGTLGNHEFDKGVNEMLRLVYGGKNPKTGNDFEGADFPYVAANVIDEKTGKAILPPYVVKRVNGMPIGIIGVALSSTPTIVTPSGVAGVKFSDEAEAINKSVAELHKRGIHAIVVLAHDPGTSKTDGTNAAGDLVDIANKVDSDVDVIFGGHNHAYMNATVNGKLLVQSYSYGTAFSDVDLKIDPRTKDIVSKSAEIVTTYHEGIQPDPTITSMIDKYEAKVAPIVKQVVGNASNPITGVQNAAGESALGDLIADSMLKAMNTDFAFMNPGGIRADLPAGQLTWGDLYTVQPFNNDLVKMDLTGAQIKQLLEQQWGSQTRMLQLSGLTYSYDSSKPAGSRILQINKADGTSLDMAATYTVTVNNFMADGGDEYFVLKEGKNRTVGPVDIDAFVNYVKTLSNPFTYDIQNRISGK
ncbi:bifunctional UDP-sugar hydrolase/5'-nucleotidase [Bacillus sp. EB600]|uniref:bifunctional metallophosphatase/5'-nucleotidase n=1 Tax=Bacillus sp. EB600 TaxID=2806345 RepID=UPI0021099F15|nr:5'-nucleotidase C-terminal domain-containing protein [Bacillus sp. EB600]MCQ6281259.1 5'-nucleotidase C-terminal domain-containing protein [Bacillus sp. EB600]